MAVNYRVVYYQLRYIFFIASLITLLFYARILLYQCIRPSKYVISIDIFTSQQTQNALNNYFDTYTWKDCKTCIKELHEKFKMLSSIEITLSPSSIAYIDIETKEPRFIVNDTTVLTYDNKLYSKDHYSDYISEHPRIYVHNITDSIDPNILHTLDRCEHQLHEEFTVEWLDTDHIYFHDKKNRLWHILCSSDKLINNELINQYAHITSQKKISTNHIVDIRFKDQVVVYQEIGERYG